LKRYSLKRNLFREISHSKKKKNWERIIFILLFATQQRKEWKNPQKARREPTTNSTHILH